MLLVFVRDGRAGSTEHPILPMATGNENRLHVVVASTTLRSADCRLYRSVAISYCKWHV